MADGLALGEAVAVAVAVVVGLGIVPGVTVGNALKVHTWALLNSALVGTLPSREAKPIMPEVSVLLATLPR